MRVFYCGQGPGLHGILRAAARLNGTAPAAVYSPDRETLELAEELGIHRTNVSVVQHHLWPWTPDLIVSVGCLEILTPDVLARAKAINCHYALLPNHRGRSSVPWAILDGDQVTGVTWHWIDPSIDTGNVLLQATCQIEPDETQATLFGKLHRLAAATWAGAMLMAVQEWGGWEQRGRSQYHRAGPPHGGEINPAWPEEYIEAFIRAMTYPPKPYATFAGIEVATFADYWQVKQAHECDNRQSV